MDIGRARQGRDRLPVQKIHQRRAVRPDGRDPRPGVRVLPPAGDGHRPTRPAPVGVRAAGGAAGVHPVRLLADGRRGGRRERERGRPPRADRLGPASAGHLPARPVRL